MSGAIEVLRAAEAVYKPSDAVCQALGSVTMIPIIGPMGVGKSTCMDRVVSRELDFGRVQSFTTRDRREGEGEGEYRWYGSSEQSFERILSAVENRELVQLAVHPTTDTVYGSDLSDFAHPYTMLDTLSTAVGPLRELPFEKLVEMTMVVDPDQWQLGLTVRHQQVSPQEMVKRLHEGRRSLEWSLEQGADIVWVNNRFKRIGETAREIIGLATGQMEPNSANRSIGERLLKHISALLD